MQARAVATHIQKLIELSIYLLLQRRFSSVGFALASTAVGIHPGLGTSGLGASSSEELTSFSSSSSERSFLRLLFQFGTTGKKRLAKVDK